MDESLLARDGKVVAQEADTTKPTFWQKATVGLMVFYYFLDGLQMTQAISYLPDYFEAHGLDQTFVGLCTFGLYFGMLLGMGLAPKASDKFGNLPAMKVALMVASIGHLLVALVVPYLTAGGLFAFYLLMRLGLGFVEGLLAIFASGLVLRIMPESQASNAVGAMEASRTLAFLVAPVFGSSLFVAGGDTLRDPYLALGIILLLFLVGLEVFVRVASKVGPLEVRVPSNETPDVTLLLKKPPTIALMIVILVNTLPISTLEPALEPYLTAAPFDLSVQQVGLFLLIVSAADVLGAGLASPIAGAIGQIATYYGTTVMMMLSLFLLALGPQTWLAVQLAFVPMSFSNLPAFVIAPAFLLRICRTYGLDPKVYSETVMAVLMGSATGSLAVMSIVSGAAVQSLGFRKWMLVLAFVVCFSPLALFWGFHPKTIGKPLADEASSETDAGAAAAAGEPSKEKVEEKASA